MWLSCDIRPWILFTCRRAAFTWRFCEPDVPCFVRDGLQLLSQKPRAPPLGADLSPFEAQFSWILTLPLPLGELELRVLGPARTSCPHKVGSQFLNLEDGDGARPPSAVGSKGPGLLASVSGLLAGALLFLQFSTCSCEVSFSSLRPSVNSLLAWCGRHSTLPFFLGLLCLNRCYCCASVSDVVFPSRLGRLLLWAAVLHWVHIGSLLPVYLSSGLLYCYCGRVCKAVVLKWYFLKKVMHAHHGGFFLNV